MKEMLKPNRINSIVTVIFFVLGMFLRIVPCWVRMKTWQDVRFSFASFYNLLFEHNFSGYFGTQVYFAYWGVSYLIIIAEIAVVYLLVSLIYKKMK